MGAFTQNDSGFGSINCFLDGIEKKNPTKITLSFGGRVRENTKRRVLCDKRVVSAK